MDYKILNRATHDTITCIQASERLLIVVSVGLWMFSYLNFSRNSVGSNFLFLKAPVSGTSKFDQPEIFSLKSMYAKIS